MRGPAGSALSRRALLSVLLLTVAGVAWARGSAAVPAASDDAVPVPIIRLPAAVEQLHWSHDGSLYGYAEGNAVVVRDADTHAVRDVVRPSQEPVGGFVFSRLLGSLQGVLSVSGGSGLAVSGLGLDNTGTVVLPATDRDGSEVAALAFDDRSGYVAVGTGDGRLELSLYLQYIRDLSRYELSGHGAAWRAVRFSTDSQWLAGLSEDGLLRVWDVRAHRLAGSLEWRPPEGVELDGASVISPLAVFGQDAPRLLLPAGPAALEVRELDGSVSVALEVGGGMRGLRVSGDGLRVDVLTDVGRLERYDLGTGRLLGHMPLLLGSEAVSFAVDPAEERILVSYEDGSLVMMEMAGVFVPAEGGGGEGVGGGAYRLVLVGPDGSRRELLTMEDLRSAGIDPDWALENSYTAGPPLAGEAFHSVELLAGTTFLPDPFVASVDVQVGYVNGFLLHPLYFGAQWRSSWGLPRSDFPYIYNGGEFGPPLLVDWVVEFPVGLRLVPWGSGVEVYAEVAAGFAMHELWNRELGSRAVTAGVNSGHFHGAFVAAVTLGVGWKGIMLKASGEWDSELGWTGQLSLGYSLRLPVSGRWSGGGGGPGHGVFARQVGGDAVDAWADAPGVGAEPAVVTEAEAPEAETEAASVPDDAADMESSVDVESPAVDADTGVDGVDAPAGDGGAALASEAVDVEVPAMDAEPVDVAESDGTEEAEP